jgi:hypothetical protein
VSRRGRGRESGGGSVGAALETIATLGTGRLDEEMVAEAAALRHQLDERLARGDGLTVAALAGGTGVGKSALLNALLGRPLAREGVRRPTTAVPLAAFAERSAEVSSLLDWLEVPERHEVGDALPAGLVLLDLPDHDSVVESHRRTAARSAQRVDVVIWVVDPVKYAREDAHDGPLASLTAHAEVLLVVLNRVDELAPDEVEACVRDLAARLDAGGHEGSPILPTSAATGEGVGALGAALTDIAGRRTAAAARLTADAIVLGRRVEGALEDLAEPILRPADLLDDVLVAVDGHRAAAEAAGLYRREAARHSRSPLARIVGAPWRAATAPLRRRAAAGAAAASSPPRTATREGVATTLLRALDVGSTTGRTHGALDRAATEAADRAAPALTDAVAAAELVPSPRRWWPALAALRTLAELVAVAGAVWLVVLAVVDWLRLPALPVPIVTGELPWPTALFVGGLLARVLLGVLTRLFARAGARRHARLVRRQITQGLTAVIDDELLGPVRGELEAQRRLREAVATLVRQSAASTAAATKTRAR